jgi:hypothetical protein
MRHAARTFRLSPHHDVVLFDRLPKAQQERLAALRRDPDFYGVIVSRGIAPATMIAASRDVALLLLTLREAGRLPAYIVESHDADVELTIEKLVLDGVLEIALDDGTFVSGLAAAPITSSEAGALGRIGRLSRAAVHYAAAFHARDRLDIEARLYRYNYQPIPPERSARVATTEAVHRFLGLERAATSSLLNRWWHALPVENGDAWIQWMTRDEHLLKRSERDVQYKVYVSPTLADLPIVFELTVAVLAEAGAPTFKVGGTARDIARPDKLVAYFPTRERAIDCGSMLAERLGRVPAQGVPFSADVGGDGLISWGVDPAEIPGRTSQLSWRRWVCRRLAQYIAVAGATADAETSQFAFERLRLEGVNTATWEPNVALMSAGTMVA